MSKMIVLLLTAAIIGGSSAQSGLCEFPGRPETSGRIYMDGVDCSYYYQCDGVGNAHKIYPCKPGEVFDPWRNMCRQRGNDVNCKLDFEYYNMNDQLCRNVDAGNLPVPGNPRMYVSCWRKAFRFPPMECPYGTQFSAVGSRCEHTDNRQYGQLNQVNYPEKDRMEQMPGYNAALNNDNQQMNYDNGALNGNNGNSGNQPNQNNGNNIISIPINTPPLPDNGPPDNIGSILPGDIDYGQDGDGDFIGTKAGDDIFNLDNMRRNMENNENNGRSNNNGYPSANNNGRLNNERATSSDNNVEPILKEIDNSCIFDPVRGDCNRFSSCQDPTDVRNCGNGTVMSKSRHVCDYCYNLTDEERQYCQC